MIPEALKEFTKKDSASYQDIVRYLTTELAASMRALRTAMLKNTFQENFESFEVSLSIEAGAEKVIRNQLRDKPISKWLRVRTNEAGLSVCDGDTKWTQDYVYLKNTHATDTAEITVVFLR